MRLTGPGVWGDPKDPDEAVRVLRRAVDLGVTFIDTADCYGPFVSEMLIKRALHPYVGDLVIATKVGITRPGPNAMQPVGRPEYLRQQVELSLRHLGLERIDLLQLHRIDPKVPLAEQIGELGKMREEGKIRHIGLSEVKVADIEAASKVAPIVSVQNQYNMTMRASESVLEYAQSQGLAFIPFVPIAHGSLGKEGPLSLVASRLGATPSQVALAWLLRRSPVMVPIPGTSQIAHLEENVAASSIQLTDEDFATLGGSV
jgi:aryl-alcohol dehydrogenase-like predicted oxidoreductase